MKIPYRTNRPIIFNSDLFHKTDKTAFRTTISADASTLHDSMATAFRHSRMVLHRLKKIREA